MPSSRVLAEVVVATRAEPECVTVRRMATGLHGIVSYRDEVPAAGAPVAVDVDECAGRCFGSTSATSTASANGTSEDRMAPCRTERLTSIDDSSARLVSTTRR